MENDWKTKPQAIPIQNLSLSSERSGDILVFGVYVYSEIPPTARHTRVQRCCKIMLSLFSIETKGDTKKPLLKLLVEI